MRPTGPARLAGVIDTHAIRRSSRKPAADLGTIQTDGSLLLDTFSVPIPQGDFLVDERFTLEDATTPTSSVGDPGHAHTVPRAGSFRPLEAGDRVLVILLDADGDPNPYVIGRI